MYVFDEYFVFMGVNEFIVECFNVEIVNLYYVDYICLVYVFELEGNVCVDVDIMFDFYIYIVLGGVVFLICDLIV